MKHLLTLGLLLVPGLALAQVAQPTPAPLIGAVAGPWGMVAAGVGYGLYRAFRRGR